MALDPVAEHSPPAAGRQPVDYAALYDAHAEYAARRVGGSYAQALVALEARRFKLPNLMGLLDGAPLNSVLEIGCATGELIAQVPVAAGGRRIGVDISPANIAAARERHPGLEFHAGDSRALALPPVEAVILSDVLEHVEDDAGLLAHAASLGACVLVNLPLEDNWLNRRRAYGPDDASGHLRRYSLAQGLALFERAGLVVQRHHQVWVHETALDAERRALRREHLGAAYGGPALVRPLKALVMGSATAVPALGRRLFASNLFARAQRR